MMQVIISFIAGVFVGALLLSLTAISNRYDYVSAEAIENYGKVNPTEAGAIAEMLETIGYDNVAKKVRDNAARAK